MSTTGYILKPLHHNHHPAKVKYIERYMSNHMYKTKHLSKAIVPPSHITTKLEVGLHQGSALILLLMDVLTRDVRKDVPGSMMFADDIVLCGDDETDMTEYLDTWRKALEERGMRISRANIQFMDFNFGQDNVQEREAVKILGEELQRVHHFKYLGSSVEETGGMTT